MLEIKHGDLFAFVKEPAVIAHGCNAQGKMGSGFARILRNRFPAAYLAYRKAYLEDGLALGDIVFANTRGFHIANIITQETYGRDKTKVYVHYPAVEQGLKLTKQYASINHLPIHLPFIGGGLANGDCDVLLNIFESVLYDVQATLWILD